MNKPPNMNTTIQWNGDSALTLFFDEETGEALTRHILSLAEIFKTTFSKTLIEAIPAYRSLTLCFDILAINTDSIEESIKQVIHESGPGATEAITPRLIEVPVCYESMYAPDLESLATYCKLNSDEVIQQHTQNDYLVNMLGFLPGFLYLSGLVEQLYCPRKETPALAVPAGAVGIGGNQTGIYPVTSPGGWHIIGQTPLAIFNPEAKEPFIAQPLDRVRFVPIDVNTFKQLKKEQT